MNGPISVILVQVPGPHSARFQTVIGSDSSSGRGSGPGSRDSSDCSASDQ